MAKRVSDELISAYLDDELSQAERALVEQALASDPASRRILSDLQQLRLGLRQLPVMRAPRDVVPEVLEQLDPADSPALPPQLSLPALPSFPSTSPPVVAVRYTRQRRRRRFWQTGMLLVAAPAAAVLFALIFVPRRPDPRPIGQAPDAQPPIAATNTIPQTAAGPSADSRTGTTHEPAAPNPQIAASTLTQDAAPPPMFTPPADLPDPFGDMNEPPPPTSGSRLAPSPPAEMRQEPPQRVLREDRTSEPVLMVSPFAQPAEVDGQLVLALDANLDAIVQDTEVQLAVQQIVQYSEMKELPETAKLILPLLDEDGDGRVDLEFAQRQIARARIQTGAAGREVARLMAVLDNDADGLIQDVEFQSLSRQLGESAPMFQPRLAQLFAVLDVNRDGAIDLLESQLAADAFTQVTGLQVAPSPEANLAHRPLLAVRQVLMRADRNRDGRISKREASRDGQLKGRFPEIDRNGDDQLTGSELYEYARGQLPVPPANEGAEFRFRIQ